MIQLPHILKGKQLSAPKLFYWSSRTTVSQFEILIVVSFGDLGKIIEQSILNLNLQGHNIDSF